MARVEVDEVELLNHRKLTQTVQTVLQHPKAGLLVEQALKMVDPNVKTPRLDNHAAANEPFTEAMKRVDALTKTIEDERSERAKNESLAAINKKVEDGKSALRRAGWTDEGIAGVEKVMEEKGLLDPLDAAAIFEKAHPPQLPATPSGSGAWNFMDSVQDGEADLKKLIETRGQSDLLADKMARDALTEVRGPSRR